MITLESRVADHCRRHDLLPDRAPLLVLVSGGPDSLCLLDMLLRLHRGPLGVLSVDHGLRAAARAEVEAVAAYAAARGCAVHTAALGLSPGPDLQARAREARLAEAERVALEHGYARIATGHTASDQAETVLFRLARGSGRRGLSGIAPRRGPFIRPLLCLTRSETAAWCAEHGLPAVDDPSNHDRQHRRARVRHDLLPVLETIHPDAQRHVAALADLLRDEAELLAPLVDTAWDRCARGGGLDAQALSGQPPALARLLVRRLFAAANLPGAAGERAHVERALRVAVTGRASALPGGGSLVREGGVLTVVEAPEMRPLAGGSAPLAVPGSVRRGDQVVHAARGAAEAPRPDRVAVTVQGPFEVRPVRPGDRLAIAGGGRRPVGRLLADGGVPARGRSRVCVVAQGERLVWVIGHRAAADLLAPEGAPAVVLSARRVA